VLGGDESSCKIYYVCENEHAYVLVKDDEFEDYLERVAFS
jgi:hypothetical protein